MVALDPTEEEVEDKAPTIDKEEVLILDDLEDSSMHEEEDKDKDEEDEDFKEDEIEDEEVTEPEEEVLN